MLRYGIERQGDREDVLYICKSVAMELYEKHGRDGAVAIAFARYCKVAKTWQKANWRMIIRFIHDHARVANLRNSFGDL